MKKNDFSKQLRNEFKENGFQIQSKSIIHVDKKGRLVGRLYVKESNIISPFWGLTENRIKELEKGKSTCDYHVILLHNKGFYSIPGLKLNDYLSNKKLAKDGAYKINQKELELAKIDHYLYKDMKSWFSKCGY